MAFLAIDLLKIDRPDLIRRLLFFLVGVRRSLAGNSVKKITYASTTISLRWLWNMRPFRPAILIPLLTLVFIVPGLLRANLVSDYRGQTWSGYYSGIDHLFSDRGSTQLIAEWWCELDLFVIEYSNVTGSPRSVEGLLQDFQSRNDRNTIIVGRTRGIPNEVVDELFVPVMQSLSLVSERCQSRHIEKLMAQYLVNDTNLRMFQDPVHLEKAWTTAQDFASETVELDPELMSRYFESSLSFQGDLKAYLSYDHNKRELLDMLTQILSEQRKKERLKPFLVAAISVVFCFVSFGLSVFFLAQSIKAKSLLFTYGWLSADIVGAFAFAIILISTPGAAASLIDITSAYERRSLESVRTARNFLAADKLALALSNNACASLTEDRPFTRWTCDNAHSWLAETEEFLTREPLPLKLSNAFTADEAVFLSNDFFQNVRDFSIYPDFLFLMERGGAVVWVGYPTILIFAHLIFVILLAVIRGFSVYAVRPYLNYVLTTEEDFVRRLVITMAMLVAALSFTISILY